MRWALSAGGSITELAAQIVALEPAYVVRGRALASWRLLSSRWRHAPRGKL